MPSRKVARVEPKPLSAAIEIPAIRSIQAGCEYYTVMIPLRQLAKLFEREDQDIPPELRAQRLLNTGRAKKIRNYVVENPQDYVLNSITVMIDPPNSSNMEFVPIAQPGLGNAASTAGYQILCLRWSAPNRRAKGSSLKQPGIGG